MLTRANSTFDGPLAPLRRGFLYALLRRVTALSRAWCLRQSPYPLDSSFSKPIRVALALRRNCDDRLGKHFSTRTRACHQNARRCPAESRAGHSTPGAAERAPQSGAKSFAIGLPVRAKKRQTRKSTLRRAVGFYVVFPTQRCERGNGLRTKRPAMRSGAGWVIGCLTRLADLTPDPAREPRNDARASAASPPPQHQGTKFVS